MKKIKIKQIEGHDIRQHPDYQSSLEWLKSANETRNEASQKIKTITEGLPAFGIHLSSDPMIYNLKRNLLGLLLVSVTLENKTYDFLLDTGAQMTCIRKSLAKRLACEAVDTVEVGDAAGYKSEMALGFMRQLTVIGAEVTNLPVLLLEEDQLSVKVLGLSLMNIQGIIGWDILRHMDFEIDLNRNLMLVKREGMDLVNFPPSDFPVVLISDRQGHLLRFGLDLGAKKSWISEETQKRLGLTLKKERTRYINGVHGPVKKKITKVGPLTLEWMDHSLRFKCVMTGFTAFLNDQVLDGVFGLDILRKHKIIIHNSKGLAMLGDYDNIMR